MITEDDWHRADVIYCDERDEALKECDRLRSALSRFDGIPDDKHLRWASEGTLLSCVTDWLKQIVAQGEV